MNRIYAQFHCVFLTKQVITQYKYFYPPKSSPILGLPKPEHPPPSQEVTHPCTAQA